MIKTKLDFVSLINNCEPISVGSQIYCFRFRTRPDDWRCVCQSLCVYGVCHCVYVCVVCHYVYVACVVCCVCVTVCVVCVSLCACHCMHASVYVWICHPCREVTVMTQPFKT